MKKILKVILSILVIGMIAFPTTVMADGRSLSIRDEVTVKSDDENVCIELDFTNAEESVDDNITITVTPVNGDNLVDEVEKKVEYADIDGSQTKKIYFAMNKENVEAGSEQVISVDADGAVFNDSANVTVSVEQAVPSELAHDLIKDYDVEDKDLTFNDESEFEVELETFEDEQEFEEARVEVALFDMDDEKVEGWIETEDFDLRSDNGDEESRVFDQDDFKRQLVIPSQDEIDAGKGYYLKFEVYGDYGEYNDQLLSELKTDTFEIEKLDNHLDIKSASFEQQDGIMYTAINVENDGEETQENVEARIEIPQMGVDQISNTVVIYEEEDVMLYVPVILSEGFETADYDVRISVFNAENGVLASETYTEELEGVAAVEEETQEEGKVIVSVDATTKQVAPEGAAFVMTLTNQGEERVVSLETAGVSWGSATVQPSTVVVGADETKTAHIFVAPSEDAQGTTKHFTVLVKEDNKLAGSMVLTAQVGEAKGAGETGVEELVTQSLKWIAAILIVVLIVLSIMWMWNKEEKKSEVY